MDYPYGVLVAPSAITLSEWNQVAATYDYDTRIATIYVNGEVIASKEITKVSLIFNRVLPTQTYEEF